MRRLTTLVAASILIAACEDGPTQTFNPSPNGAGDLWNDGKGNGTADPAAQGFGDTQTGQTLADICTAPQKKKVWGELFNDDIVPPLGILNINNPKGPQVDMSGGETWTGLKLQDAEKLNCQSASLGDAFGDGNQTNAWGDNQEIIFEYRVSTRKLVYLGIEPGFTGKMKFKSADLKDSFELGISSPILKNGQPYLIQWDFADTNNMVKWATELTNAMFATYAGLPPEANCLATGHCVPGHFGDQGYLFIPAIGAAFRVSSITAAQPTPSTVSYMDSYLEKIMPFSLANARFSLDTTGPHALALGLGPQQNINCDLHLGMTYKDLLDKCVRISGDPTADKTQENKLLGGLSHGTERFRFDLSGVDVNFTDNALPPLDIVHDKDLPHDMDTATQFRVDQATLGRIANDRIGNDPTASSDIHGTGFVYAEFIRLTQQQLNAAAGTTHKIGDPACLTGDLTAAAAIGCTGLEGFLVPLDPTLVTDPDIKKNAVPFNTITVGTDKPLVAGTFPKIKALRSGLKPGHQQSVVCDTQTGNALKPSSCSSGDTFVKIFNRVLQVFGKGKIANLPIEAQDARFYWRTWSSAFVKYVLVTTATDAGLTTDSVANAPINANDFFFDSIGSGQFETAEYIDRRFAKADPADPFQNLQDITDLSLGADVRNGIFNDFTFSRDVFRGETAIYTATRANLTDPVGFLDVSQLPPNGSTPFPYGLTNIFGSPLLSATWSGYDCATGLCPGTPLPMVDVLPLKACTKNADCTNSTCVSGSCKAVELDGNGNPLLTDYPFAFNNGTTFTLGITSPISIKQTIPNILSAVVHIPIHQDPGDYLSPLNTTKNGVDLLIPWLTKQPGVGFPIAISGTRDRFVQTYQIDFSGTTISANVDYDFIDPKDQSKGIQFLAVETTDYLGDVFLCWDAGTRAMLHARMYTSVGSLLDWIGSHKTAADACGMIVRFSPYNNFPDFITSLTYGVRLGITQGGGFGRVVDTTLFVPGQ